MNYFTKEWYELCQKTSAHFLLEEAKEAETFSEEYFHQLYKEKLAEWIVSQEEVAAWLKKCKEEKENYILPEPFDREKAPEEFRESLIYNQEHIKKMLPKRILEKIADIRVYALGKASHQVIKEVTEFCEDNEKAIRETSEEYRKYYKKALKSFDRDMVKKINFHDCTVVDIKQNKQCLSIIFDNSGGFTNIDEIIFENYKIIKQESPLRNLWWLYDEIYKIDDKYELHVLLQDKNMDLVEFIISAEYISFRNNQEYKL